LAKAALFSANTEVADLWRAAHSASNKSGSRVRAAAATFGEELGDVGAI
jgi:hypothetical protein